MARLVDRRCGLARALTAAGAFSAALEKIPEPPARAIAADVAIPTIGFRASPARDGQILVLDDMVGVFADALDANGGETSS